MSGGGSRGDISSQRKGLAAGAGQNVPLSGNENFEQRPHLEVTAALRAWAERQPHDVMFVADLLAEQVDALAECPDNELLHDGAVESLEKLQCS
jgi:hypothetical protein